MIGYILFTRLDGMMSFKENLLKKIQIDKLAEKVLQSLARHDNGPRIDKESMKSLLGMSPYHYLRRRDLDLYVKKEPSGAEKILVLDNELAIYRTSSDDVVLRKSPTIKEMISIRNIIKILNDSNVVVSKKSDSVKAIQAECVEPIDLSLDSSDLESLEKDAIVALEIGDAAEVLECLSLFAEILEFKSPPQRFLLRDHELVGALVQKDTGEILFGPIVIFSTAGNTLKIIDKQISSLDREAIDAIRQVATGKEKASGEGTYVFRYLKNAAVKKMDVFHTVT